MPRNDTWTNDDGLIVGYGTHSADNEIMAVIASEGNRKVVSARIDLTALEDTDGITAASISPHSVIIPQGSYITRATVVATETVDSAGDAFTLDIGTYDSDTSSITADDADGIDADIAQAELAVGLAVDCNGDLVGGTATVGDGSDSDVVVVLGFDAAAATAGEVLLTVEYITPSTGVETILTP